MAKTRNKSTGRKKKKTHDPADIAKLTELKNIGKARAVKLLDKFKSADTVLNEIKKKDVQTIFSEKISEQVFESIHYTRVGRGTKYNEEVAKSIIKDYVSSGKVTEVCQKNDISVPTFFRWRQEIKEFREAIKSVEKERTLGLKELALEGMSKLLKGYDYQEKHTIAEPGKKGGPSVVKEVKFVDKHVPPNPAMIIFTAVNTTKDDDEPLQSVQHVKVEAGKKEEVLDLRALDMDELKEFERLMAKAKAKPEEIDS